jgi:hypothetical protein
MNHYPNLILISPKLVFLTVALALGGPGCVYTRVKLPAKFGETPGELTRWSLAGNQSVGKMDLKNGTLEAYQSEQAEVAGAIAGQVAAGVAKALVKP